MLRCLSTVILTAIVAVGLCGPAFADAGISNDGNGEWSGRVTWKEDTKPSGHNAKKTRAAQVGVKKIVVDRLLPKREAMSFMVMCREAQETENRACVWGPKKRKRPSVAEATLDLAAVARTLVTQIGLPDPTPRVGPDPVVNEWGMVAVGFPLWLWTAGPGAVSDRVRAYGVTFTLRARWVSTRFDMGDGHSVLCTRMQPYTESVRPGSRAPWCGYSYGRASLPEGSYTVTATTNWRVRWSALGVSGSMPASFTGTRMLPVGELNALIVK